MKKITFLASIAIVGFAVSAFVSPNLSDDKGEFEGVVTYSINVSDPQYAPSVGNSLKVYIKGSKSKTVQEGGFTKMSFGDTNKPNNQVTLIDIMGSKYLIKNDTTKKDTSTPVVKYEDATKKIAGYACHKAEVTTTVQGQAVTVTVYYTEDIVSKTNNYGSFKGLKGFPLEYAASQSGITVTYTATKVSKESLTDDIFKPHVSGYKPVTAEELRKICKKT